VSPEPRGEVTEEQRRVVDLPVDARTFVVAGPGTGKTHVLVHRLAHLATQGVAASEVLVLTFTNAVVGELRRRLAEHKASDVAYVRPITIDSFAGRMLGRVGEDPMAFGFDETVTRATVVVSRAEESGLLARVRHMIVDEAQDLVGPRLEFVAALLRACQGGFTVLGDPAQGIYGFTRSGRNAETGIDALREAFPTAAIAGLTRDHRSLRGDAAPGHALRALVADREGHSGYSALKRRLHDCDHYTVDQLPTVLRRSDAATAVLSRTNGEALLVSGLLAGAGVVHTVRRAATANVPPDWIARILGDVSSNELSRARFGDLANASDEWIERSWIALRRTAGGRSGGIDIGLLRERLAGLKPEEAPEGRPGPPIISTVHRSKGLEYDTVIVLEPPAPAPEEDQDEEARVLYVAMTRARRRTTRLERPDVPGRLVRRRGRWVLIPWRGRGLSRIELRPGDVAPTLDEHLADDQVHAGQKHLRDEVRAGDSVVLTLLEGTRTYGVIHGDRQIGTTSEHFASFADALPTRIDDVRIDCVRSAATDPARTANLGLGGAGFYLAPELVGLGRLAWKDATR
jgi:hypothetical protein